MKQPTYKYFVKDKDGNSIDVDTLTEEERKDIGVRMYQTMLKAMGYEPVQKKECR